MLWKKSLQPVGSENKFTAQGLMDIVRTVVDNDSPFSTGWVSNQLSYRQLEGQVNQWAGLRDIMGYTPRSSPAPEPVVPEMTDQEFWEKAKKYKCHVCGETVIDKAGPPLPFRVPLNFQHQILTRVRDNVYCLPCGAEIQKAIDTRTASLKAGFDDQYQFVNLAYVSDNTYTLAFRTTGTIAAVLQDRTSPVLGRHWFCISCHGSTTCEHVSRAEVLWHQVYGPDREDTRY